MAIDYADFFGRIGKHTKHINLWLTRQGAIANPADAASAQRDIWSTYTTKPNLNGRVKSVTDALAASYRTAISALLGLTDTAIGELQAELKAASSAPASILPLLFKQMVADAQTVNANTIAAPTVTPGGANVGNAEPKIDASVVVVTTQTTVAEERGIAETVDLNCDRDSSGGATAGQERLVFAGPSVQEAGEGINARGFGSGQTIQVAEARDLAENFSFDAFTANVPDGWTVVAGTAGTHIKEETSIVHVAGGKSLHLDSDGIQATITLEQAVDLNQLTRYGVGVFVRKGAGAVGAGSNLKIALVGTGMSDIVMFNADPTTLTTSFVLKSVFGTIPAKVPTDLKLQITWTSANLAGATADVYIDTGSLVLPIYRGYYGYAVFRGSIDPVLGDTFRIVTANNYGGVFQTFLARFYGFQAPSNAVGEETISDGLAT